MPSVENALLISKVIEINLTTLNSHFSLILHLQLACSKYHICASFISVIFSNIIFISEHEFRWLIDEKYHFFFYRFLFDTTNIISLHWNQNTFIPFFEGRIYVPFFNTSECSFWCVFEESQISYLLLLSVPKNMDELKNKVQDIPQKLAQSVGEVTEKCSLQ